MKQRRIINCTLLILIVWANSTAALAEGWFSRMIIGATSSESVSDSGVYKAGCGSCHIAYQPHLLPAISWERLMAESGSHFGEKVEVSSEQAGIIRNYLLDNGAGRTADPLAARIMAAQGAEAWPLRATEMVFFRERHQNLSAAGKQVEMGRCEVCHKDAEQGSYKVLTSPNGLQSDREER